MPVPPHTPTHPEGDWVFWAVLAVPTLVLLACVSVRRVGRDELVLVVRRGRVARSAVSGWVARSPGLERFVVVPTHRQVLPLVVRARTRDDVDVLALADLVLAVGSVPDATPYADPAAAAVRVAEDVVAQACQGFSVVTLVDAVGDLEECLPAAITRRLVPGSVASGLIVREVEAQLTPRLARDLGDVGAG